MRVHRLSRDRFAGMDLLYRTTTGVASAGGAATHPGWYHNVAAHPDAVQGEVGGVTHKVTAPRLAGYGTTTDRQLPVLRLVPTG